MKLLDSLFLFSLTDSLVLFPITDSLVLSPVTDSLIMSPVTDSLVMSPVADSIVMSPITDSLILSLIIVAFNLCGDIVRISGGNDKQGFPMKQGVLTTSRERKRKSIRGCIVDSTLSVLALVSLTPTIPRRQGPKRASKIRKLFNLSKEDDVRQYVRRQKSKAPKIQRLVTPVVLQRKRHRLALKKKRVVKKREDHAEYQKLLAARIKEAKECKAER
ncbi:unnamed protein product [Candidula unifasciata]|uniref:Small ribosomal subunit protein eS6 n=1 Tax=Candidula unifasciata TaxID=100452 RepID=A0A8S3ZYD9_9EUPU|nr:unnamed protein product [Candidula unifasciata]